jgi:ATP:ADP antiporter, AAA family
MCFVFLILIKGLSYALNNPTKEVLYIPTSKDVKFKSKSWTELFGSRLLKGGGESAVVLLRNTAAGVLVWGSVLSLGIVGVWIMFAKYVSGTFEKLQKDHTIIE